MKTMTKQEFKQRWESSDDGGGITFDEIAKCAKEWGISSAPKTRPIDLILYQVLEVAQVVDCGDYNPINLQNDNDDNENECSIYKQY